MSKVKEFYDWLNSQLVPTQTHWSTQRDTDCPFCLKYCGNTLCPYAPISNNNAPNGSKQTCDITDKVKK